MIVAVSTRPRLALGLVLLASAPLSACGKQADSGADRFETFDVAAKHSEDQFGEGFGEAYRADPNSEPRPVADGDVVPVSMVDEPIQLD